MLNALSTFLKVIGSYGDPVPRYTEQRCLIERRAVGGCNLCEQICPQGAITIDASAQSTEQIKVNEDKCTGCGLCTGVCPTGALEFDIIALLGAVHEQKQQESAKLVCSKANESGKTVICLAHVTSSVIVAAGAWNKPLELVHGDCAGCSIGGPEVPIQLQQVVEQGKEYGPALVIIRSGGEQVFSTSTSDSMLMSPTEQAEVTRRNAFGSFFQSARRVVADLIPDRPLPFVDWSIPHERIPAEWVWRRQAGRLNKERKMFFWPAPIVNDKCISCPVCVNVCPTEAIFKEIESDGRMKISLHLSACTGCGACVRSCPPDAMQLTSFWKEEDFADLVTLRLAYPDMH